MKRPLKEFLLQGAGTTRSALLSMQSVVSPTARLSDVSLLLDWLPRVCAVHATIKRDKMTGVAWNLGVRPSMQG
jgi:hypothetical protein